MWSHHCLPSSKLQRPHGSQDNYLKCKCDFVTTLLPHWTCFTSSDTTRSGFQVFTHHVPSSGKKGSSLYEASLTETASSVPTRYRRHPARSWTTLSPVFLQHPSNYLRTALSCSPIQPCWEYDLLYSRCSALNDWMNGHVLSSSLPPTLPPPSPASSKLQL